MPITADFEVISSRIDKIVPGDMEVYPFTLPENLRHGDTDPEVAVVLTFHVIKAKNLKWEVLVNDMTESQFYYSGDFVFTWQLFPEASQLYPGDNQLSIYVKPKGSGVLEVKGVVLHYRIDV